MVRVFVVVVLDVLVVGLIRLRVVVVVLVVGDNVFRVVVVVLVVGDNVVVDVLLNVLSVVVVVGDNVSVEVMAVRLWSGFKITAKRFADRLRVLPCFRLTLRDATSGDACICFRNFGTSMIFGRREIASTKPACLGNTLTDPNSVRITVCPVKT